MNKFANTKHSQLLATNGGDASYALLDACEQITDLTDQVDELKARIAELEAENERLREEIFDPDLIIHDKPKSKRQIKATLKGGEG